MGSTQGRRPEGLLATLRTGLRFHDSPPARRRAQPRLYALVDDVQPAPVAGSRATAESHRQCRELRLEGARVWSWWFSAIPALPELVRFLGPAAPPPRTHFLEKQPSPEVHGD